MHKLFSSLLCCSVDSKDDHDKVQQPVSARATTSNTKLAQAQLAQPKDEESVNETETITNTNDTPTDGVCGSKTMANIHTKEEALKKSSQDDEEDDDDDDDDDIDDDDDVDEDDGDFSSNGHLAAHEDLEYEQLPQELDLEYLKKLQPGQSFNEESGWLLPIKDEKKFGGKKCLILDLDETLVHSSFKYLRTADFVIPVEIDNQVHHVYVIKRPGVDEFLKKVGEWFEVVVFTASVSKYGDPLLNKLDINNAVHHRLYRDSCYNYQGNFIKNLSQIGRPLADSIIIDNSPASYIFHPQHSIPISSWFSDTHDNELLDLLPFLHDISQDNVDDVGLVLDITL